MSIQHIDVDSEEFEDAPKALRDHVKKLQKELGDLSSDRDKWRTQVQSQALGSVLADQGFKNPDRVKRDLLADQIDPLDTAAVETWLAANGDDYAKGQAAQAATPVQDQNAQQLQAIQQVAGDATTPDAQTRFERALEEINSLGDKADGAAVKAIYAKHGV